MTDIPAKVEPMSGNNAGSLETRPTPRLHEFNAAFSKKSFFGPHQSPWSSLEEDPAAELIKRGPNRKIWRVAQSDGSMVFAKVFDQSNSLAELLKRLLQLHPAVREWRALDELESCGIPSVRPIALASYKKSRARPARMILLSEGIPNAATLTQAWNARSGSTHAITATIAALWALAHEKGYAHPDGHPGNVLLQFVRDNPHAGMRAFFIDPGFSRTPCLRNEPLQHRKALHSLAMLDQHFHRVASRSERLRFWRQYWTYRKVLLDKKAERALLVQLAFAKQIHSANLARKWDRRLRGDGKYFTRLCLRRGWRATVALRPQRPHVWPDDDFSIRTADQWTALLSEWLVRNHPDTLPSEHFQFRRRPDAHSLFLQAHRLRNRDIHAPLILGFVQKTRSVGTGDQFLILPSRQSPCPTKSPL